MSEAESTSAEGAESISAPVGEGVPVPISKTAYVVQRLKQEIANGVIYPGQSLRQMALARRYGVSATPVREALRVLEADGAITYAPHRGASLKEPTAERRHDLYLVRAEVEGLATALCAERADDTALEHIQAMHRRLTLAHQGRDMPRLAPLNRELHFAIYEGASSEIAEYIASLWTMLPPKISVWWNHEWAEELQADHEQLIEAIMNGDPIHARQLMSAHIMRSAGFQESLSGVAAQT